MQSEFNLYKVDMKYIRNLHNIDDKVLSVSPQTGKDNRVFVGIVVVCGMHKYCIPLSSPKANVLYKKYISGEDFSGRKRCLDFPKLEQECKKFNLKLK